MKLSNFVLRQLPAFVKENHPKFVKFIQAYYEFMETSFNKIGTIEGSESVKLPVNVVAPSGFRAGDYYAVSKTGYFSIGPTTKKKTTSVNAGNIIVFTSDGSSYVRDSLATNTLNEKDLTTNSQIKMLLDALSKEVSYNLPDPIIERQFFLQRVRDLYCAKGSQESFKFLFRVLFNEEIEILYPSEDVLKTSDGTWTQNYSIFVRSIAGDPYLLTENIADVLAKDVRVKISTFYVEDRTLLNAIFPDYDLGYITEVVEAVVELGYTTEPVDEILELSPINGGFRSGVFEVFVDRNYYGKVSQGDIIVTKDANGNIFIGSILSVIQKAKVYNAGKGFRIGDLIPLETSTGKGCVLKVTEIEEEGGLRYLDFLKFGYEYKRPFAMTVTPDGKTEVILEERIEDDTDFFTTATLSDKTGGTISRGYTISNSDYAYDSSSVVNYELQTAGEGYTTASVTFSAPDDPSGIQATAEAIIHQLPIAQLSGTIKCNIHSPIVESYGDTKFLTELFPGDVIKIPAVESTTTTLEDGILGKVLSVQSNTRLTLEHNARYSRFRSIAQKVKNVIGGIKLLNKGLGYLTPPIVTIDGDGSGATARSFIGNEIYFDLDYCGSVNHYFKYNRLTRVETDQEKAMLRLYPGPIAKYGGYYQTSNGFLSDSTVLHDGEYYQDFSYVIVSDVRLTDYEAYVKSSIHPAGMLLFGQYSIDKEISDINTEFDIDIYYTRSFTLLVDDEALAQEDLQFTNVVFAHELDVDDSVGTKDDGYVVDDPYTMPYAPVPLRMWGYYTEGDAFIGFTDDND